MLFDQCRLHFNSIKVRLKQLGAAISNAGQVFQFHKGTIKTNLRAIYEQSTSRFQFHKGTIKTYPETNLNKSILDFNSIKVRLKLGSEILIIVTYRNFNSIKVRLKPNRHLEKSLTLVFQFHKGTIKTRGGAPHKP